MIFFAISTCHTITESHYLHSNPSKSRRTEMNECKNFDQLQFSRRKNTSPSQSQIFKLRLIDCVLLQLIIQTNQPSHDSKSFSFYLHFEIRTHADLIRKGFSCLGKISHFQNSTFTSNLWSVAK